MDATEIDKELEELDTKIDQLRALYEQYFMGIDRIEPQKPRQDVERRLKVLRREQIRNTAQRFKFNVLVQRMNTMQQYWGRVVREIENGTFKRDVIKAAARFGEGALTGLSKKRANQLAKVAAVQAKRTVDDAMELDSDDLIEDEEEVDEVPTPPKPGDPGYRGPRPSSQGLGPGDLPVIQGQGYPGHVDQAAQQWPQYAQPQYAQPQYAQSQPDHAQPQYGQPQYAQPQYAQPQQPQYAQPQYAQPSAPHAQPHPAAPPPYAAHGAPPQPAVPAASPSGAGKTGLRIGSSDPSSSIRAAPTDVKRRVAELAAEMRGQRGPDAGAGFGSLDLDFDDAPSSRRAADPAAPAPRAPGRPIAPPAARGSSPSTGARAAQPPAAQPPAGSFGVLDLSLDGDPGPPAPSPSSPGSGVRVGGRPLPAQPRPQAAQAAQPRPAPAAPASGAGGELADARLRQIYAKYVETKRGANESTAGITYEKLAATLKAQTEKLKAQHPTKAVDFDVVVKDGKTHLKPVLR